MLCSLNCVFARFKLHQSSVCVTAVNYFILLMFVKHVSKSILTFFESTYPLNNQPVSVFYVSLSEKVMKMHSDVSYSFVR